MLVFVYGTLMTGFRNNQHTIGRNGHMVSRGKTKEKFTLYASGIPFMVNEPRTQIHGEIWELNERGVRNADFLEGHPDAYKRTPMIVINEEGEEVECQGYVYQHEGHGNIVESGDYRKYVDEVRYSTI